MHIVGGPTPSAIFNAYMGPTHQQLADRVSPCYQLTTCCSLQQDWCLARPINICMGPYSHNQLPHVWWPFNVLVERIAVPLFVSTMVKLVKRASKALATCDIRKRPRAALHVPNAHTAWCVMATKSFAGRIAMACRCGCTQVNGLWATRLHAYAMACRCHCTQMQLHADAMACRCHCTQMQLHADAKACRSTACMPCNCMRTGGLRAASKNKQHMGSLCKVHVLT